MATQKDVIFKVKYGDIIKHIHGSLNCQQLNLNVARLWSKIREWFSITPDKGFVLTYVDADGDTILLRDDADLHDALIKQGLNPLKIDIKQIHIPSPSLNPPAKINFGHTNEVQSLGKDVNRNIKTTYVKKSLAPSDKPCHNFSKQAQVEPMLKHAKPNWSSVSSSSAAVHVSNDAYVGGQFAKATSPNTDGQVEQLTVHHGVNCYKCGANSVIGTYYKSNSKEHYNLCANCFPRWDKCNNYSEVRTDGAPGKRSFKQAHSFAPSPSGGMPMVEPHKQPDISNGHCSKQFPKGKCEVCGANPILGTSYKSNLKENFHICSFCFSQKVVTFNDNPPTGPCYSQLNSGSVKWPYGIILSRIGASEGFIVPWEVKLEIPKKGLAVNDSVDVSLDLKAPSRPGRYYAQYKLEVPTRILSFGEPLLIAVDVGGKPSASKNATAVSVKLGCLGSIASSITHAINVKPTTNAEIPKVVKKSKASKSHCPRVNLEKGKAIVEDDDLEELLDELFDMGFYDEE
ncbi:NBR1-like protein [Rhynchospora pubera]|uniref:NBR1-like protein n=1 Tax=Rhynchospora pubera TaxID=906938 RepID=A0AAV8DBH7_9POAL|nr:NBR1-like protein [Rhynchospora pubera]